LGKQKSNKYANDGAEATGIGVGTFIVGASRYLGEYPRWQSFVVFIAPFAAVLVNTYVRRAFEKYQRNREFRAILRRIDSEINDERTSPARKEQLQGAREKLLEAQLEEMIEEAEFDIRAGTIVKLGK
jgi:hypothetical protein